MSASDPETGVRVIVEVDRRTVKAVDTDGQTLWTVDAIRAGGDAAIGDNAVRNLSIGDGRVDLVYGKHAHVWLELRTGRRLGQASDKR